MIHYDLSQYRTLRRVVHPTKSDKIPYIVFHCWSVQSVWMRSSRDELNNLRFVITFERYSVEKYLNQSALSSANKT